MGQVNGIRAAHMGRVNSIFLNLEAGVVIGLEEDSIKIWDPVNGVELHVYDAQDSEDVLIPAIGSMSRIV